MSTEKELQQAVAELKVRVFDAEETAKHLGQTNQGMVNALVTMFGLEEEAKGYTSLDDVFEAVAKFAPIKDETKVKSKTKKASKKAS